MLSVKEAEISTLQKEKASLEKKADDLQKKLNEDTTASKKKEELSNNLLLAVKYYNDGDRILAASAVSGYTEDDFTSEETKELFRMVSKELTEADIQKLFEDGRQAFNSGKYDEAERLLTQVISIEEENQDALYFMGRVYHQRGKKKKAREYYQQVIDIDSTTRRAAEAKVRMNQLG